MIYSTGKIYLVFIFLALLLCLRYFLAGNNRHLYHQGQWVDITTLILTDIDSYASHPVVNINLPDALPPQRLSVYFSPDKTPHFGQNIRVSGKINQKIFPDGSRRWSLQMPGVDIIPENYDAFFNMLYNLRSNVIHRYYYSISDIDSSLLLGIVFGIKTTMPKDFSQNLQATGVTHVIAASGMNVTMVAGFMFGFLGRIFRRRSALVCVMVILLLYALFAGLQPSIVRATIMGIAASFSQLLGRQYKSWYILLVCGWLMLMISPWLIFDIGFQLSFLSTLGILFIQPVFHRIPLISEDIAATTAAQLATLPIMVINFGQYSLVSILVNGLVLWTVPPLMIIGGIGALISIFIPLMGTLILYLAVPFLWFFETIVSFFGSTGFTIKVSNQNILLIIGYYLLVISTVSLIRRPRKNTILLSNLSEWRGNNIRVE